MAGTAERPRLVVTRSARHIFVQVVDDPIGKTVASASTMEADLRGFEGDKTAKAKKVGELVAERAEGCRCRRGRLRPWRQQVPRPHRGHCADGAREGGLTFDHPKQSAAALDVAGGSHVQLLSRLR